MDDLISRKAAMAFPLSWEHRDKEHGSDEFISGVECYRDYIEGLPSIHSDVARDIATIIENEQDMRVMLASKPSAQQWIPVSEMLPEIDGYYLVTIKTFGWNGEQYEDVDIARYERKNGWLKADKCIAWRELPDPYKGGIYD